MSVDSHPPDPGSAGGPQQGMQTPAEDLVISQIAVEKGMLRPDQLEAGLREQEASRTRGESAQLCQILIRMGSMTADDLVKLVREQSRRAEGVPNLPRYEVQARLGEGATAVVYRAWDRELRRLVALKILRESTGFSEIGRQRFRREAQAAAGLTHANVITVHDAGEVDGRLYLVMELVEGKALSEVFREPGSDLRGRVGLIERAARGVAAAHEKGIVHRDLKPQNILVAAGGEPKVADFGLAHMTDSTTALTRTGSTLGTPLYMSPEQVAGKSKEISPRTDVWALGAMLYEVLAGMPPFGGETHLEIYERISRQDPPALSAAEGFARDLETVALKAMEKEPDRRYPSAREFADDLRRLLGGEAISARRASPLQKFWKRLSRRPAVVGMAAVLLAAGGWAAATQWRHAAKVRNTFTRATEDEKAGRLQEARDGYRIVRELDPGHAEALRGFERTSGELERGRQTLVDQARAREEAVKFMKPAVLEGVTGAVEIATDSGRVTARTGENLPPGSTIRTIGPDSRVTIRYLNAVTIELDIDTTLQQWLEESAAGSGRAVALKNGALRISVPSALPGKPVIFSTPQLEVESAPARFRLAVEGGSSWIVVESGMLRARRRSDGATALIEEGRVLECREQGALATQAPAPPGGLVVADFDSHVDADWVPSAESNKGSLVRRLARPGIVGPGALHLEYRVPENEMVWVNQEFPSSRDWSSYSGVSFWFKGGGVGTEVVFELWENRDPRPQSQPERFWFTFRDDSVGWRKFDVPWREFKRRTFPGTPNDGFTQKEMWGVCVILLPHGAARQGSCEFDQIELIPNAPAQSQKPWTSIFDGRNLDGFVKMGPMCWHVENGAMIRDAVKDKNSVMTVKRFDDAEIRIRFDVPVDIDSLYFAIRATEGGRYRVVWQNEAALGLKGRPHDLIFVCRGDSVSATLDGRNLPLEVGGRPRQGALQFEAAPGVRVYAIDYREIR